MSGPGGLAGLKIVWRLGTSPRARQHGQLQLPRHLRAGRRPDRHHRHRPDQELDGGLPADASRAGYERIVVISRDIFVAAAADLEASAGYAASWPALPEFRPHSSNTSSTSRVNWNSALSGSRKLAREDWVAAQNSRIRELVKRYLRRLRTSSSLRL